ncbi:MAG: ATP synthase subunit I [Gammaproteobacteria bacterium]
MRIAGHEARKQAPGPADTAVVDEQTNYSKNRAAAHRMLAVEVGITAAIALLLFASMGAVAARSAALGGLIFVVPNALFVAYAFRRQGMPSAMAAVRGLYVGETLKLSATAFLFAAGFMLVKPLNVGILFVTYLTLLLVNLAGNAYLLK